MLRFRVPRPGQALVARAGPRILLDLADEISFGPWRELFSSFMALANPADGEAGCIGSRYSGIPWDQAIE